jgi:peptide/nickel transport system permease protein
MTRSTPLRTARREADDGGATAPLTGALPPGVGSAPVPAHGSRVSLLRPLALYALTLMAVVTLVFALPRAMPGDPLSALGDPDAGAYVSDPAVRERVLAHYGLDRPLPEQYVSYLGGLARGDLGWSITRNTPVSSLVAAHLPWTLLLVGIALALASLLSWVAGVAAAWWRGTWGDRAILATLTGIRGIPEYALAALFLVGFAVIVPIFPLYGARTPFGQHTGSLAAILDVARHLVLPAAALTLSLIGTKFLLVRNTVVSALGEDYMLLARAKGLPRRRQMFRHAGRNALLPFLTVLGVQAGFAVGGAVFVEAVFAYPGMGRLILTAVEARDYPVLEAVFLVLALAVLLANLLIELVYRRLDPRVGAE